MKNNSVINSSTPLVNSISNFKQVVCEPNIDNNSCDNSLNKPKEKISNNSILITQGDGIVRAKSDDSSFEVGTF